MQEYDMEAAVKKAKDFLESHNETVTLKSADIDDDGIWHIIVDVGFLSEHLKDVKIHAGSGKILGYTAIKSDDGD